MKLFTNIKEETNMASALYLVIALVFGTFIMSSKCKFVMRSNEDHDLYYFGDSKHSDYSGNKHFCENIGGSVPSVHSEEDTSFIFQSSETGDCIWLGATNQGNQSYRWEDESAFDYQPWAQNEPSCQEDCCAVCMGTQVYPVSDAMMFISTSCDNKNVRQVCRLNFKRTDTKERLLDAWDKFSADDHTFLSANFFTDFLSTIVNLTDEQDLDRRDFVSRLASMNKDLEEVRISVRKNLEENAKKMRDLDREIQRNTNTLSQKITATNESMRESFADINNFTNAKLASFSNELSDYMQTTDVKIQQLTEDTEEIVDSLKEKTDLSIKELDQKVEKYQTAVNNSLEQNSVLINGRVSDVESELSDQIHAIDSKVGNYTLNVESESESKKLGSTSCSPLHSDIETKLKELSDSVADLKQQIKELQEEDGKEEESGRSKRKGHKRGGWWSKYIPKWTSSH